MGLGLSVFDRERGYKGRVRWEEVRGELERYLGEWYWLENVGKGCMVFGAKWVGLQGCSFGLKEKNGKDATLIGCNWARIGPSKSSQSLSIAHKWAVVID
ncbi:hypothetical protein Tco_1194771 [Tanacetum coccineum]